VGIPYISEKIKVNPLIHGGAQERNMRAGTENVYGIVGFAKALERATANQETETALIKNNDGFAQDFSASHQTDLILHPIALKSPPTIL